MTLGKHVIFGTVIQGWDLVKAIEAEPTKEDKPLRECKVEDCGLLPADYPLDPVPDFAAPADGLALRLKDAGTAQFKENNLREAVRLWNKAAGFAPEAAVRDALNLNLALCYNKLEKFNLAAECAKKVLQSGDNAKALFRLGLETLTTRTGRGWAEEPRSRRGSAQEGRSAGAQ